VLVWDEVNYARIWKFSINGISGDLHILIDEIKEEYFKRDGGSFVEKEISVIDAIIDLMFLLELLVD
jgi:DnaJ-class molecular chaperone